MRQNQTEGLDEGVAFGVDIAVVLGLEGDVGGVEGELKDVERQLGGEGEVEAAAVGTTEQSWWRLSRTISLRRATLLMAGELVVEGVDPAGEDFFGFAGRLDLAVLVSGAYVIDYPLGRGGVAEEGSGQEWRLQGRRTWDTFCATAVPEREKRQTMDETAEVPEQRSYSGLLIGVLAVAVHVRICRADLELHAGRAADQRGERRWRRRNSRIRSWPRLWIRRMRG